MTVQAAGQTPVQTIVQIPVQEQCGPEAFQGVWPQQQQPQPQPVYGTRSRMPEAPQGYGPMEGGDDGELRRHDLRTLVQHLYVAQARVQLEATEIKKAQAVATSTQAQLEESANHVRAITASLHTAQQEVAASAIRAQIAQLQLAAHDQLLFAARQDVDALSSQMVGLQAAEGIVQPKMTVDLHALLDKLRQPLQHVDRPTAVPAIVPSYSRFEAENQRIPQQQQQYQVPMMQPQQQGVGLGMAQGQGRFPESQGSGNAMGGSPSDYISLPRMNTY
nr:uncharacterized protein LOC108122130 [Drosophila bipectinata]